MPGFCNLPASVTGEVGHGGLAQWPVGHVVTWNVSASPPGLSVADVQDLAAAALKQWNDVSGSQTLYVPRGPVNVSIGVRQIDGPMGILAEAQLPYLGIRPDAQLRVWLDGGERWVEAQNLPQGAVPPGVVLLHELGHSFGHGHDTDGKTNAIMDPAISHLRKLQEPDIYQQVLRYGKRGTSEPPTEPGNDDLIRAIVDCLKSLSPTDKALILEGIKAFR